MLLQRSASLVLILIGLYFVIANVGWMFGFVSVSGTDAPPARVWVIRAALVGLGIILLYAGKVVWRQKES